jgi:hypothetical protein
MRNRLKIGALAAVLALMLMLGGCLVPQQSVNPQMGSPRELICIECGGDSYMRDGGDLYFYADRARATQVAHVDGATGNLDIEGSLDIEGALDMASNLVIAVPTAQATATAGVYINNASVADALVVADDGTNFLQAGQGGVIVSAPTAVATAVPALEIDSAGVSKILDVRDGDTTVFSILNGGNQLVGSADGTGIDVTWYSDTAGDTMLWDASEEALVLTGTNGQDALEIPDGSIDLDDNLDVNGQANLDEVDIDGVTNLVVDTEHIGAMSILSSTIQYDSSGALWTIAAGELWIIHAVYANVTTNFDSGATNDSTVEIGDGNDTDGLLDLDDAELQTADTEGTGAPAGWQGFMSTDTRGAYLANGHGFIYNPGSEETIDVATGGTGADAGEATIYILYTRVY